MSDGLYERLMKIAWFLVLIALQAACTNASTTPESTQSSTVAHSPTNSPHPSTTSTPSPTGTFTATSTVTATSLPTFTLTASSTPSPTAEFGLCPIDMAIENSRITIAYDEFGYNYDLWAPHGTSIRSPGECSVISLFIASNGTQGLHVSCSDYPLNLAQRISYAHIDLAWNDYETLKIYGIPIQYLRQLA